MVGWTPTYSIKHTPSTCTSKAFINSTIKDVADGMYDVCKGLKSGRLLSVSVN